MSKNLTKKEIGKRSAMELINRARELIEARAKMPSQIAFPPNAAELVLINAEMRGRLIKMLGRDFYPLNSYLGGEYGI